MHTTALMFLACSLGFALAVTVAAKSSRRRKRSRRSRGDAGIAASSLYDLALQHLRQTPYDRMGAGERRSIRELIARAEACPNAGGPLRARLHSLLAEMALVEGDHSGAIDHFRQALREDPQAPVRRTLERLENPNVLSFCARRPAASA